MRKSTRLIGSATLAVGTMLGVIGTGASAYASTPAITASATSSSSSGGYIAYSANGSVSALAGATNYGSAHTSAPIVGGASVPGGGGYWLVASDGTVYTFGDAKSYGDTYTDGLTGFSGSKPLNAPIVGMAVTPNGGGYWLVASDGGVFDFGNAPFLGSTYTYGITGLTGSKPLNAPITAIVSTPTGNGYWLIAKDGGVFDFGNAPFLGSTYTYGLTGLSGSKPLDAPVIGAIATPSGQGYYMVAADGGVFDFGDAHFEGSAYDLGYTGLGGKNPLPAPVSSLMVNPNGSGYYALCKNGTILAIGGAPSIPAIKTPGTQLVGIMPATPPTEPSQPTTPTEPKIPTEPSQPTTPTEPKIPTAPIEPTQPTQPTQPSSAPLTITSTNPVGIHPLETGQIPLTATGGNGSYSWSTTSPNFVIGTTGLNPNPSDPPVPGDYTVPVTVTSGSATATANISVAVSAPQLYQNTISRIIVTGQNFNYGQFLYNASVFGSGYTFSEADPTWWSDHDLTLTSSGSVTGDLSVAIPDTQEKVNILADNEIMATVPVSITLSAPITPSLMTNSVTVYPAAGGSLAGLYGDGIFTFTESGMPSYLSMTSTGVITVNSDHIPVPLPNVSTFDVTVTSDGLSSSPESVTVTVAPVTLESDSFNPGADGVVNQALAVPPDEGGTSAYTYTEGNNAATWAADNLSLSSSGTITGSIGQAVSGLDVDIEDGTGVIVGTEEISFSTPTTYTITSRATSINWAGLVADTSTGTDAISQAGGTFTVPTLSSNQPAICTDRSLGYCQLATWVGIDGSSNGALIQAGVSSIYSPSGTQYQPWYEVITPTLAQPESDVTLYMGNIAENVSAGDQVSINIYKTAAHTWTIVIDDLTTGGTDTISGIDFTASVGNAENAEWINESPQFDGLSPSSGLCKMDPVSSGSTSCAADAMVPWITAGGNFTNMSSTTTAPFASLNESVQSQISESGYDLATNGDGLFTPNLTLGQTYTIGSLDFTQSQETPTASIDAEAAPRSGAPASPLRVLPN